jgi:hypothetical protein
LQRLDETDAIEYLDNQNRGSCLTATRMDYGLSFIEIGGWPALEQSYLEAAPVCGECDPPNEEQRLAYARAYLAAGTHVIEIAGAVT